MCEVAQEDFSQLSQQNDRRFFLQDLGQSGRVDFFSKHVRNLVEPAKSTKSCDGGGTSCLVLCLGHEKDTRFTEDRSGRAVRSFGQRHGTAFG